MIDGDRITVSDDEDDADQHKLGITYTQHTASLYAGPPRNVRLTL